MTMTQMVNGRIVELRTEPDGSIQTDALWRAAGIPANRQLIHQRRNGGNRIINHGERLRLDPEEYFIDAPPHERGATVFHKLPAVDACG